MKKNTTLSIQAELIDDMKKKNFNMSEVAENAFRQQLKKEVVEIEEESKCNFCGRPGEKATRFNLDGLTWLYPDERWICKGCLKTKCLHEVAQ